MLREQLMIRWLTLPVRCFSVYCSQGPESGREFTDFNEAEAFVETLRQKYPSACVQLHALIEA